MSVMPEALKRPVENDWLPAVATVIACDKQARRASLRSVNPNLVDRISCRRNPPRIFFAPAEPSDLAPSLFSPQCLHRIDSRCPPRRDQAGQCRHHKQRCSHDRKDRWIEWPGSIEH